MEPSNEDKLSRRLSNPELRCKNKCGFYGNPIYLGYCSKCYKELVRDASKGQSPLPGVAEQTGASPGKGPLLGNFLRFSTKKKVQSSAKSHSRFFRGGGIKPTTQEAWQVPLEGDKEGKKGKKVLEPFNEFLKTLRKPAAQDIVAHLKSFHKHIAEKPTASVDEQSEAIQDFYMDMAERLQTHTLFRNMSEEQQGSMMDGIEKHLMTNIYNEVFSPSSCDDEMKDLLLRRRIRMLHWLEPGHLDIPLKLDHPEVQELISKGRQELWAMDTKKAPQDKLSCVSKCCTTLLSALRLSQDGPASADEFLPSFIFMIIYTSPQHVHSNINYISRFSNPSRLMTGEAGYYFTHLCGAVSFIENVSADNLHMSEEAFNEKMGYADGKTDVDLLLSEGQDDLRDEDTENKQILQSCCDSMDELVERLTQTMTESRQLQSEMNEFRGGLREQIDSILSTHPHTLTGSPPTHPHTLTPPTGDLIDFSEHTQS